VELKFETPEEAVEFFKSKLGLSDEDAETKANELFEGDEAGQGDDKGGEEATEKSAGLLKGISDTLTRLVDKLSLHKSQGDEGDGEGEDDGDGGDLGKSTGEGDGGGEGEGDGTYIDVTAVFNDLSKDVTTMKEFQAESTGEFAKAFGAFAGALEHIHTVQKSLESKVEKVGNLQQAMAKTTFGFSFADLDQETLAGGDKASDKVQVPAKFGEVMKSLRAAKKDGKITGQELMEAEGAWHNGGVHNPVVKSIYAKAIKEKE